MALKARWRRRLEAAAFIFNEECWEGVRGGGREGGTGAI